MKLSQYNDPWNEKKKEIDPWNSPWRKKHEEDLEQGKSNRPCAFDEQEHSQGGKPMPRVISSMVQRNNSTTAPLSPHLAAFLIFAGIFVIFLLYALIHLIAIFSYNESLFMALFWGEYFPPLLLLGGLALFFLGRWKKSK